MMSKHHSQIADGGLVDINWADDIKKNNGDYEAVKRE